MKLDSDDIERFLIPRFNLSRAYGKQGREYSTLMDYTGWEILSSNESIATVSMNNGVMTVEPTGDVFGELTIQIRPYR